MPEETGYSTTHRPQSGLEFWGNVSAMNWRSSWAASWMPCLPTLLILTHTFIGLKITTTIKLHNCLKSQIFSLRACLYLIFIPWKWLVFLSFHWHYNIFHPRMLNTWYHTSCAFAIVFPHDHVIEIHSSSWVYFSFLLLSHVSWYEQILWLRVHQ